MMRRRMDVVLIALFMAGQAVLAEDRLAPKGVETLWTGTMIRGSAWAKDTMKFFAKGWMFRVEIPMGSRTKIKLYDGQDYYEYWEGGSGAYRAKNVNRPDLWKVANWWSVDRTPHYQPTGVDRLETLQGQSCRYREFLLEGHKTPVKEWVWPMANNMTLKRETPFEKSPLTTEVAHVSEMAEAAALTLFALPPGVSVKPKRKGSLDQMIGQSVEPFHMKVAGQPQWMDWSAFAGKVVVLNFFATWCGPCRKETPDMVAQYHAYKDQGVEFVSVDIGEKMQDDPEALVAKYVKEYSVPWPIVMDDEYYHLQYAWKGVPTTFIVDRQGVIRAYNLGGARKQWFDVELRPLLAEKPDALQAPR